MTFNVHTNGQAEAVPSVEELTALGRAVWQAFKLSPRPLTYEFTRNLDCLPGELSPNGWHKEA